MAANQPKLLTISAPSGPNISSPLEHANLSVSKKIYSSLSEGHIRTVTLHGGLWSEPIRCTLTDVAVDEKPSYDALSYVWGSQDDVQLISLNEEDFKITRNLYAALQNLRSFFDRVLWIDALCINQSDLQERNAQVKLMKSHFSKAEIVVAWIGPASRDMELLIDHINEGKEHGFGFKTKLSKDPLLAQEFIGRLRHPLFEFLSREYWSRAWISQEVAASQRALLFCGSRTFGYIDVLSFLGEISEYIDEHMQGNAEMLEVRKRCVFSGPRSLPLHVEKQGKGNLILWYSDKLCHDPRDKVFALWGLLPKKMQDQIPVDYQMSTTTLFTLATKAIIDHEQSLDAICYPKINFSGSTSSSASGDGLPSWAANLEFGSLEMRFYAIGSIEVDETHVFSADRRLRQSWKKSKQPICRFSDDGLSLTCKGVCTGLIASVHSEAWPSPTSGVTKDKSLSEKIGHSENADEDQEIILTSLGYLSRAKKFLRLGSSKDDIRLLCSILLGSEDHLNKDQLQWIVQLLEEYEKGGLKDISLDDTTKRAARVHVLLFMQLWAQKRHLYSYFPGMALENLPIPEHRCIGLGTTNTLPGDLICIIIGCSVPVILRKVEEHYIVVGDTYVYGIMEGQVTTGVGRDSPLIQDYCLR